MYTPPLALLSRTLIGIAGELAADPANAQSWSRAEAALGPASASEPELARIIAAKDAAALRALADGWVSGTTMLPEPDRALLKRALKAFKKRLKVTRLDEESRLGVGAMTGGKQSSVVGITPPDGFAPEVWEELVRQKRLAGGRHGIYELLPEPRGPDPLFE